MKGQQQYANLQAALQDTDPACKGDPRFIADDVGYPDAVMMRGICRSCPVINRCADYAPYAEAGFWAGSQRGTSTRKRRVA